MTDLNMMMRDQAKLGLQTQLDAAVTAGNTEEARKITDQISALAVQTAPKAPPYTNADVWRVAETKAAWLGVDPKKTAMANEFAKTMNPNKFTTAEALADAVIKAVEAEFKPAAAREDGNDDGDDGTGEDGDGAGASDDDAAAGSGKTKPAAARRTDGPGERDATQRQQRRTSNGPWTKIADAPADVQKEINRSATKFLSSNATKEQRATFVKGALESHYQIHQRKAGKT